MATKYWRCPYTIHYTSPRYGKEKTIPLGYPSDGATGATDLWTEAWWVHDGLVPSMPQPWPAGFDEFWGSNGAWDDGTPCTPKESSWVLHDILKAEGRWFRAKTWFLATFLYQWCKHRR